MITVQIYEGEAPGRGQLSFDNPDVAMVYILFFTTVTKRSGSGFQEIKRKVA